jgi:hypothetical protein
VYLIFTNAEFGATLRSDHRPWESGTFMDKQVNHAGTRRREAHAGPGAEMGLIWGERRCNRTMYRVVTR